MRCRSAERLIYLHREGERSQAGERRLDRHLRACPSCAAEAERVREILAPISTEGIPDPGTFDPAALTGSILTRIRYLEGGVRARSGAQPASPFGRRTIGGRFRPIAATAAILLAVGILTEGFLILDRIALLERRLEGYATRPGRAIPTVAVDDLNRELHQLQDLEAYLAAGAAADPTRVSRPEEWIVVRRSDLRQMMSRYVGSDASPEVLLQALAGLYPELREITLADGLNRTELQLLIDHSPKIIRAVHGT